MSGWNLSEANQNSSFNFGLYTADGAAAATIKVGAAATAQASYLAWAQALTVALGGYKQYKMYDQMGDMYQAQQGYIEKQRELIDSQYNELSKPQYQKSSDFLWQYAQPFSKSILETVIKCGIKVCDYVKDGNSYNRAVMKIGPSIARARRRSFAQVGVGQIGLVAENEYRYTELEARLMTKSIAVSERYEDQRKLQWEQFYWTKMTSAGQIAQNIMSTGANLLTGGANGIQNVISAMGQSAQIGSQIAGQQATAMQGQINMIGGIGTIVGQYAGQQRSLEFARQLYGVSGMNNSAPSMFRAQGTNPVQDAGVMGPLPTMGGDALA
jgi:hypothetical protein